MMFSDPLERQLREIAWTMASRSREPSGGILPADPQDFEARNDERLAGCLGMLRAYTRMIKVLQRRIDVTVNAALELGASHGQVAAACGVSRQAARQRWLRRSRRQDEQFALPPTGGRPDRDWDHAHADRAGTFASPARETPVSRVPRPTGPHGGTAGAKIRVYELAKEFGVPSTVVMTSLQEMGEFIRSAASTVEAPLVRRLREKFSSQQITRSRSQ